MENTLIFGHQKPDTDTVTSAIVLSYLRNKLGDHTEPRVLGDINNETKFVLDYFKFDTPKYLNDVRLQIKDTDYSKDCFLHEKDSIYKAYNYMMETSISTVPVVNEKNDYLGAVCMKFITQDLIDGDLGTLDTSYNNIIEALKGEEILRFNDEISGNIIVPSSNSDSFKKNVDVNSSVIIVGERKNIFDYVIKNKCAIIILTDGVKLTDEQIKLAKEYKINVISTDYDGITTANLVVFSNYIRNKIKTDEIITVNENDALFDALEVANKKKYSNYPILNNSGKCLGVFRANITDNKHPKKVILVDHNEREQSVVGLDEAEIIEIVDHHKIGNIGTSMPINFRNMPLGCTETILYLMFKENGVDIPKNIAGLMMSGIISDTLLLSSPTTTDVDRRALKELAEIAGVDFEKYGMEMFKAGSSMEGKSISEIIHGDFKNFTVDNQKVGIGQVSTMSTDEIMSKQDEFISCLNEIAKDEDYAVIALFVTDILKNGSYIFFNEKALDIISNSFGVDNIKEGHFFEGLVSRKKQIVPKIMNYMDNN
ncbi:MAG: putative manganese-dependent inorganic diphosphatase [Bacilli bacterium]|nr:putative manganese-dependent inorganic diphosphatase [Bacilli bacterium]